MSKWRDFPLPDGSYADASRPWSQQDVVNYLPVPAELGGTRSAMKLSTVPGLRHFAHAGDGPHRGSRDVEGKLFVVSGRKLYQVAADGTSTELGTIPGTSLVTITHNQINGGNEVLIGTRDNSYIWNTVTETLTATGAPLFSVDFLNQRFLGIDPARRFWRYSALADGMTWQELDNESAESSPDRIVGGKVCNGEWYVFGERTIEVWSNTPTEATAFQRVQVIEKGCANANTIVRMFNTLFFVGDDNIPYMLTGYTPQAIAPKAIIQAIGSGDPRKLFAHAWEDNGHAVYYITAQDGQTFGYDVTTQRWHRRESFGLDRWRINTLTKWRGDWYAGDFQNGRLYRMEAGYVYEGCEIMPRKITSGVLHNADNRVRINGMRMTVATGGPKSEPYCPGIPGRDGARFLGTGQISAGIKASARPLSYYGTWMGSADVEVDASTSISIARMIRFGGSMVAMLREASARPIRTSAITDLATWASGATLPSSSAQLRATVSGSKLFTFGYSATISYLTSPTDTAFVAGATLSGGTVDSVVYGLSGNGSQMVAVNGYGQLWGSSNNGSGFTVGADLFNLTSPNRFYTAYGAIDYNGSRFVIGGGESSSLAYYTDDRGASATACTLPVSRRAAPASQVKHCGGGKWLITVQNAATPVDDGLYLSIDNGANFTAVDLPAVMNFDNQYEQSIALDSVSKRVVIFGKEHGTNTPRAFYTDDFANWTEISRTGTGVTGISEIYPQGVAA